MAYDKLIRAVQKRDVFILDRDQEMVTEMYYNPDSEAGGSVVVNRLSKEALFVIMKSYPQDENDDLFVRMEDASRQEIIDKGSTDFAPALRRLAGRVDCDGQNIDTIVRLWAFSGILEYRPKDD